MNPNLSIQRISSSRLTCLRPPLMSNVAGHMAEPMP